MVTYNDVLLMQYRWVSFRSTELLNKMGECNQNLKAQLKIAFLLLDLIMFTA